VHVFGIFSNEESDCRRKEAVVFSFLPFSVLSLKLSSESVAGSVALIVWSGKTL